MYATKITPTDKGYTVLVKPGILRKWRPIMQMDFNERVFKPRIFSTHVQAEHFIHTIIPDRKGYNYHEKKNRRALG